MISQDEIQEFNREKRDYVCNDDFATFVQWRQMKALQALAALTAKLVTQIHIFCENYDFGMLSNGVPASTDDSPVPNSSWSFRNPGLKPSDTE